MNEGQRAGNGSSLEGGIKSGVGKGGGQVAHVCGGPEYNVSKQPKGGGGPPKYD